MNERRVIDLYSLNQAALLTSPLYLPDDITILHDPVNLIFFELSDYREFLFALKLIISPIILLSEIVY